MRVFVAFATAAAITAGLVAGAVFVLREDGSRRKPKPPAEAVKPTPESVKQQKPRPKTYPYPECEVCMQWLRNNTGEPDSIQIIEWDRQPSDVDDFVVIIAKFRGKNQVGGWSVDVRRWGIKGGKITWTQSRANGWKDD